MGESVAWCEEFTAKPQKSPRDAEGRVGFYHDSPASYDSHFFRDSCEDALKGWTTNEERKYSLFNLAEGQPKLVFQLGDLRSFAGLDQGQ